MDKLWLLGDHSNIFLKFYYIVQKYYALFFKANCINYLGHKLEYDNKNMPVTLQSYPTEINFLNKYIDFSKNAVVLDVGANIGQFSITLNSIFNNSHIFSFEPNPNIYTILSNNISSYKSINTFNFALGPPGKMDFYSVPGASGKGSFIEANAVINLGNVEAEKYEVELIELDDQTRDRLGVPTRYDLIKIDVEGFEYEVLEAIKHIETKYLYIEFSMNRSHQYSFYDLLARISDYFGIIDILYCDQINLIDTNKTIGNLLVKCTN